MEMTIHDGTRHATSLATDERDSERHRRPMNRPVVPAYGPARLQLAGGDDG